MIHNVCEKFQLSIWIDIFKRKCLVRKNETHLQQLPQKDKHPSLLIRHSPDFKPFFSPDLLINKIDPFQYKKGESTENEA